MEVLKVKDKFIVLPCAVEKFSVNKSVKQWIGKALEQKGHKKFSLYFPSKKKKFQSQSVCGKCFYLLRKYFLLII